MTKQILIIGGGLSGLTLLHHLHRRFGGREDIRLRLLEKENRAGGDIFTRQIDGCLFEEGPNGFLNNRESLLQVIDDLGLRDEIVEASPQAAQRYIVYKNALHNLPAGPPGLFRFSPLPLGSKLRVLAEGLIPKGNDPDETVEQFGRRRFGENFARYLLDPMVSGVFAGRSDELVLRECFPRIHELEQRHGSLIRAFMKLRKSGKTAGASERIRFGGKLCSLKQGMGQLTVRLYEEHADLISLNEPVSAIERSGGGYAVVTARMKYYADELYVCTPASEAARLLGPVDAGLTENLERIEYAPVCVAGLMYNREKTPGVPEGFGFLIPSDQQAGPVLGVLFSDQIFPGRAAPDKRLYRVMMGGARHPDVAGWNEKKIVDTAKEAVTMFCKIESAPVRVAVKNHRKGIPQYTRRYSGLKKHIERRLAGHPHLHLNNNYLGGVSMNDCAANSRAAAEKLVIE